MFAVAWKLLFVQLVHKIRKQGLRESFLSVHSSFA